MIARVLATRRERFRQLILINRAGLRVRAIQAAVAAGCMVLFFEVAKQALYPKTSIWTTHTITILLTMLATAVVSFAALNQKAEGTLRQSETVQRLASIVECSQDAIIGKTIEGVVTSWNQAADKDVRLREY
jgi:PAS domain-containing protein